MRLFVSGIIVLIGITERNLSFHSLTFSRQTYPELSPDGELSPDIFVFISLAIDSSEKIDKVRTGTVLVLHSYPKHVPSYPKQVLRLYCATLSEYRVLLSGGLHIS